MESIIEPKPFWYQEGPMRELMQGFNFHNPAQAEFRSQFLCAPCGYGKTFVFTYLANQCIEETGQPALIMAHREELIRQPAETYWKFFQGRSDIIKSGWKRSHSHKLKIASIPTLYSKLKKKSIKEIVGAVPPFVVVDEGHLGKAKTWLHCINSFPDSNLLIVSATPTRLDGSGFHDIADRMVQTKSVREMEEIWKNDPTGKSGLVPDMIFRRRLIPDMKKINIKRGEYDAKPLNEVLNTEETCKAIVAIWRECAEGLQTIAYCIKSSKSMDMGLHERLAKVFNAEGIPAAFVDGKTPADERAKIFAQFKAGEIKVLTNMLVATTGTDIPGIQATLMLNKTNSLAQWVQMGSRGKRPAPGKEKHVMIDCVDNIGQHGPVNADHQWTLDGVKKAKRKGGVIKTSDGIMTEQEWHDFDSKGEPMTFEVIEYNATDFRLPRFKELLGQNTGHYYRRPEDALRVSLASWLMEINHQPELIELQAVAKTMFPHWKWPQCESWARSRFEKFRLISRAIANCGNIHDANEIIRLIDGIMINRKPGRTDIPLSGYFEIRGKVVSMIRKRYLPEYVPPSQNRN
jgi:superfamily II DNA or RNA helicase